MATNMTNTTNTTNIEEKQLILNNLLESVKQVRDN